MNLLLFLLRILCGEPPRPSSRLQAIRVRSDGRTDTGDETSFAWMFAEGLEWLRFPWNWLERGEKIRRARDGGFPSRSMALGDESSPGRAVGPKP